MGTEFEVYGWLKVDNTYKYVQQYAGNSLWKAIYVVIKLNSNGCKCIKIEWRP